jgi:hypothetical protein
MLLIETHICSAYCRPPEHCELIYLSAGAKRGQLWQAYATEQLWVTDAVPAREAPNIDLDAWRRGDGYVQLAGVAPGTDPWLVWWRTDYAVARSDFNAGRIPEFRSPAYEQTCLA